LKICKNSPLQIGDEGWLRKAERLDVSKAVVAAEKLKQKKVSNIRREYLQTSSRAVANVCFDNVSKGEDCGS
jgi:hypothetical protein